MIRRRLPLARDQRGAIIVELAMVAPVLALMVIGVVDMSNAFSRKLALEQGAQRALEKIMQTTDDDTVEGTLKTEAVCQVNGTDANGTCKTSPITTSDVTVTYRVEFANSAGTITATSNTDPAVVDAAVRPSGTVSEAHFILIKVNDKYTPIFPFRFSAFSADGTYHLSATAGMRQS